MSEANNNNEIESFPVTPGVVPGFSTADDSQLAKRVDRYAGLNLGQLLVNQDLTHRCHPQDSRFVKEPQAAEGGPKGLVPCDGDGCQHSVGCQCSTNNPIAEGNLNGLGQPLVDTYETITQRVIEKLKAAPSPRAT